MRNIALHHHAPAEVVRQAWRLRDVATTTVEQLRALQADDLTALPTLTPPEPSAEPSADPATA